MKARTRTLLGTTLTLLLGACGTTATHPDTASGAALSRSTEAVPTHVLGQGGLRPAQLRARGPRRVVAQTLGAWRSGFTDQVGSSGEDYGIGVATDVRGNLYVVGEAGAALPGQAALGDFDGFIAKYDARGQRLWLRQFGTPGFDTPRKVAVDLAGNAYVAGETNGALNGQANLGGFDGFLVKYGPDGNVIWTRQYGTPQDDFGSGVATDLRGNVYVTGETEGGSFPGFTNAGGYDTFVVALDASGTRRWTWQSGTAGDEFCQVVTTDLLGRVYLASCSNGEVAGAGRYDGVLTRLDPEGRAQWTRTFGTAGVDVPQDVKVDVFGGVYVAGETNGSFAGFRNAGSYDPFLVKLRTNGAPEWVRQLGSPGEDYGYAVGLDLRGNVYLSGDTPGRIDGGGGEDGGFFVARYGLGGEDRGIRQFGSANEFIEDAAVDPLGGVTVTGSTGGDLTGAGNAGAVDAFVSRLTW